MPKADKEAEALVADLKATSRKFLELLNELKLPTNVLQQLSKYIDNATPAQLADLLSTTVDATPAEKLEILGTFEFKPRLTAALALVKKQISVLSVATKIHSTVEGKLSKKEREIHLRQQLKAIKEELEEKDDAPEDELEELQKKIDQAGIPEEAEKSIQRELKRIKKISPMQQEYAVLRTYLEWVSEIPWNISTTDNTSIEKARAQLDDDHFGLEKVKRRIIEFLAVKKLKNNLRGPILCFVGPPGVGKTSLGKSIADALGRKFHRISLGGVRDEAEIRGHRRTYVGALPGRIVHALRKVGTNNPVILLDEIDKMGHDIRGDPAAALLEVLDPEQNSHFTDHYLAVPLDLSKVLFIATANSLEGIPPALLDRMELVQLPGYTTEEKLEIAKSHLVAKQVKEHGIPPEEFGILDDALTKIISQYTREAGVRSLERNIGAICRYVVVDLAENKERSSKVVTPELVAKILGPEKFDDEISERLSIPGVVAGLSTSQIGGSLLFIEATKFPGSGKLTLTGQLGDVIKESAQAAVSWVRANASAIGLNRYAKESVFDKVDIHIHFPAGAIKKDGPSAGVALVTAIVSLLSNRPVKVGTAMTGEIALRGLVLPVGGIKDKVLAAHRSGIKRVILPFKNRRDLIDVPAGVQKQLEIIFVKNIPEVLLASFGEELGLIETPVSQL